MYKLKRGFWSTHSVPFFPDTLYVYYQ